MDNLLEKMSQEEREALEALLPADNIEEAVETVNRILTGLIESKSLDEPEDETEETEETEGYEVIRTKIFAELDVKGLQELLTNLAGAQAALTNRMNELEMTLQKVKQEDDLKIAQVFDNPIQWGVLFKSSEEEENSDLLEVLKDEIPDQLKKSVPEGTENSVLDQGFWQLIGAPQA